VLGEGSVKDVMMGPTPQFTLRQFFFLALNGATPNSTDIELVRVRIAIAPAQSRTFRSFPHLKYTQNPAKIHGCAAHAPSS
jgi:hypothetical protein